MDTHKSYLFFLPIVFLLIGLAVGYFYGLNTGDERGRANLLVEQETAQKAEAEEALKEIQEAANPFSDIEDKVNPFKDSYTNPFAQ